MDKLPRHSSGFIHGLLGWWRLAAPRAWPPIASALVLCSVAQASGQIVPLPFTPGMLLDGRQWRIPTDQEALQALTFERDEWDLLDGQNVHRPIASILRQAFGPRPEAELDALANDLADRILADESMQGRVRRNAATALRAAARRGDPGWGTPHRGSVRALVRVYETLAAEALAGTGGNDPILEAARRWLPQDGWPRARYHLLTSALFDVLWSDPEGFGRDYVLDLIGRNEPPPRCWRGYIRQDGPTEGPLRPCPMGSTWCLAGNALYGEVVHGARKEHARRNGHTLWEVKDGSGRPAFIPPEVPEAAASWYRSCDGNRPRDIWR